MPDLDWLGSIAVAPPQGEPIAGGSGGALSFLNRIAVSPPMPKDERRRAIAEGSQLTAEEREQILSGEPPPSYLDTARTGIMRGFVGDALASKLKGVSALEAGAENLFDIGDQAPASEGGFYGFGQALQDFVNEYYPADPRLEGSFVADAVPRGLGQVAEYGAEALLTRGNRLTPAVTGALQEAGSLYDEAINAGATEDQAQIVAAFGVPLGATEAIGIGGMMSKLARVNRATGGLATKSLIGAIKRGEIKTLREGIELVAKNYLKTAPKEVGQEVGQTIGENVALKRTGAIPERRAFTGVPEAAGVAAVVSGPFSVLGAKGGDQPPPVESTQPDTVKLPGEPVVPEGSTLIDPPVPRETNLENFRPNREYAKEFVTANPEGAKILSDAVDRSQSRQKKGLKGATVSISDFEKAGIFRGKVRTTSGDRQAFANYVKEELQNASQVRENQGQVGQADVVEEGQDLGGENLQQPEEAVGPAAAPQGKEEVAQPTFQDILGQEEAAQTKSPGAVGAVANAVGRRTDTIGEAGKENVLPDDAEVARRVGKAFAGVSSPSLATRAIEKLKHIGRTVTRQFEFLPDKPKFAVAIEALQAIPQTRNSAIEDASRAIKTIVEPLGPNQRKLFTYKLALDDAVRGRKEGNPLRFGFKSDADLESEKARIYRLAQSTPAVKASLEKREAIATALTRELADAGLLPEEAAKNTKEYYHRQVFAYAQLQNAVKGTSKVTPTKFSFQKSRIEGDSLPEEFDYNLDYVQAEGEWMTHALTALNKKKWFDSLMGKYDIAKEVRAKAKSGGTKDLRRFIPEDHTRWSMQPGHVFYPAFTIPDSIANKLIDGTLEEAEISADDLRKLIAVGAPKTYIIPNELAAQLDEMERMAATKQGAIDKLATDINNAWKVWTLIGPHKLFGIAYNLRNLTGDIDPILGGAIPALKEVPTATNELWKYFYDGALTDNVRTARDLGVIDSSMTATEIPELSDLPVFSHLYESNTSLVGAPAKATKAYFDFVKKYTKYREAVLRYAAFRYYQKALNDGTLKHYGGAKKGMVQALRADLGDDVAAAYLSRKLLGDYRATTVFGTWLATRMIPFWRFQEVNMKRYPRMAINAADWAWTKSGGKVDKGTWSVRRVLPLYAAMGFSALGFLYAAMAAWNRLMFPDEERDLGSWDRQNPHIILGKLQDGSALVLRNVGAVGDLMEWFGLNTIIGLLPKYEDGTLTMEDLLKEAAKDPLNKLVQGSLPIERGVFETATGTTTFPDVTAPRKAPRDEIATGVLGLRDIYKEAKGRIAETGERSRPNLLARTLLGVSDPRANALSEAHALREKFLKSKGKPVESGQYGQSPTKVMRDAVVANDYEAFLQARGEYLKGGRGYENFKSSIDRLDPVDERLSDEEEVAFEKFLTGEDRDKVRAARDYAQDLKVQMWSWWRSAAEEKDQPSERAELDSAIRKEMYGVFMRLTDPPKPERKPRESAAEYLDRRQKRGREIKDAEHDLTLYGMSRGELTRELRREHRRRGLDITSDSFQERLRRLRRSSSSPSAGS